MRPNFKLPRVLLVSACIFIGAGALRAQINPADPAQVQREIERLERLLELQRQVSGGQSVTAGQNSQNNPKRQRNQGSGTQGSQGNQWTGQDSQGSQSDRGSLGQPVGRWYQGEGSPANEPRKSTSQPKPYQPMGPGSQKVTGTAGSQTQAGQGEGQNGVATTKPEGQNSFSFSLDGGSKSKRSKEPKSAKTARSAKDSGGADQRMKAEKREAKRAKQALRRTGDAARYMLKTNLIYDAALLTPNIGFDIGIAPEMSVGVLAGYNNWHNMWELSSTGSDYDTSNAYITKLDHWSVRLEFKYWLHQRFTGHAIGTYLLGAQYTAGDMKVPLFFDKKYEYDGFAYGGGFSYSYLWPWSKRWGMEFVFGVGVLVAEHDKKEILFFNDMYDLGAATRHRKVYIGPTTIGVNLAFKF